MAIMKQLVPLPIDKGLDTKLDIKQEEPGYLRTAENVVYETLRLLRKRNGYKRIELRDIDDTLITGSRVLSRYKDEVVLMTGDSLYTRSQSYEKWIKKGTIYPTATKTNSIIRNSRAQERATSALVDNFEVYAWEDSSGGIRYSVRDSVNGNFIVSDNLVVASGERPRVAKIQNNVYIFYADTTNLRYKKFNILTPTALSSAVTAQTNLDGTDNLYDVESVQNKIFVAYNSTIIGAKLAIFNIDQNDNVSSTASFVSEAASKAINITSDEQFRIICTWSDGTDVKILIYSFAFTAALLTPTVVEAIADVVNVTAVQDMNSSYRVFYEIESTEAYNHYTKKATVSLAGMVSGIQVVRRSIGLASRAFKYNGTIYVNTAHESLLQSTYFLIDEDGNVINKINSQDAEGLVNYGVLRPVFALSDTTFLITNQIRGRTVTESGVFFALPGINSTVLNFSPENIYQSAYAAENLHICAGILMMYDGDNVVEHGYHLYPENLDATGSGTGGSMSDGNYAYVAVYRWTDNNGRDHLSAPTPTAFEITLSSGGSTQSVDVVVPTLRLTNKEDVVIDIYRTEDAGTTYYKVTSNLTPVENDTTVDTVTFKDTLSDTDLIQRELLYTTGGVVENIAAPSCSLITQFANRLAVVGEEGNRVYFSKLTEEGKPVEFTDLIYKDFDPVGGDISAIAAMTDKLVVFQRDATQYIGGSGPNNLLGQDSFTTPELVTSDIGCLNPDSVVLTPMGLMFKSRKGIWLLTGGFDTQYVGARVEQFNDRTITSAEVVGELNQIRFTCSEEVALVYNYNLDRWATFTNHGALSAVVIENDYYYLREDGELYEEDRTSFSDASSPIKMRIETGWLSLNTLQGFQRIYSAMVLGTYKSSHKLNIKVAYNFVDAYVQEELINVTDFIDENAYGDYSPYGDPSTVAYGGNLDGNLYQMRVDMERQKCQSIKLLIEDAQDEVGEGLSLSSITLKVGAKQGEFKLPATNKYGVS